MIRDILYHDTIIIPLYHYTIIMIIIQYIRYTLMDTNRMIITIHHHSSPLMGIQVWYPIYQMAIEIADLPIKNGETFHDLPQVNCEFIRG